MILVKFVLRLAIFAIGALVLARIGLGLEPNFLNIAVFCVVTLLSLIGLVMSALLLNLILPTTDC